MMEEKGISLSAEQKNQIRELAKQGRTPLLFADENQFLGIVAVADVVKPTSKEAVQKFRDYGIHVIMSVSYTHLRAHETDSYLVCRLLLEKKK